MLQSVDVGRRGLDAYRACAGEAVVDELRCLAAPLDGVRVLHANATAYGGGVAEILRSEVPLPRDLGVVAEWRTITAEQVNAFQRHADVVIQKPLREGFGLVVSEATWKGIPVVAGRAGGIPLQLPDGVGGHLVDTTGECAEAVPGLLADPAAAVRLAAAGRGLVHERFLLPRLTGDELRLITSLLGHAPAAPTVPAAAGTAGEDRDPVRGMRIDGAGVRPSRYRGREFRLCSASCARQFAADPELFRRAVARARRVASPGT
ncbi:glycosyltransferase [Streptomyces sp. NPDC014864]|uniref:glycosyltransferase n=1 Tax=Streptomyces sp. NPDC014864 TaxID=3364924 RepID=UPI0036F6B46B